MGLEDLLLASKLVPQESIISGKKKTSYFSDCCDPLLIKIEINNAAYCLDLSSEVPRKKKF